MKVYLDATPQETRPAARRAIACAAKWSSPPRCFAEIIERDKRDAGPVGPLAVPRDAVVIDTRASRGSRSSKKSSATPACEGEMSLAALFATESGRGQGRCSTVMFKMTEVC